MVSVAARPPEVVAARATTLRDYWWPRHTDLGLTDGASDDDTLIRAALGEAAPAELDALLEGGALGLALVEVRSDSIRVDGRAVLDLPHGRLPPSTRVLAPVSDALTTGAQAHKTLAALAGAPSPALRLLVVADASTPYDTLQQVLFAAGVAQFARVDVAVRAAAPPSALAPVALPEGSRQVRVQLDADRVHVSGATGGAIAAGARATLPDLLATVPGPVGCGSVSAPADTPWSELADTLSTLLDHGVARPGLGHATPDAPPPAPMAAASPGAAVPWSAGRPIHVVPVIFPPLGPPPPEHGSLPECLPSGAMELRIGL